MKTRAIKLNVTLKAKPAEVFSALATAKKITAWSGQKASVGAKKGGRFSMFDGWVKGKVVTFKKGKELAYTWSTADWSKAQSPSVVRYKLTKSADGTKVALTHSGLPNAKEAKDHKSGWPTFVFNPLKKYLRKK